LSPQAHTVTSLPSSREYRARREPDALEQVVAHSLDKHNERENQHDTNGAPNRLLFPAKRRGQRRVRISDPSPRASAATPWADGGPDLDDPTVDDRESGPSKKRIRSDSDAQWKNQQSSLGKSQTPTHDRAESPHQPLACPFIRLDPRKYQACLHFSLSRIKDVKQHIYRRHKKPDRYCARCHEVFDTTERRDDHLRDVQCDVLPDPKHEGITDKQKKELGRCDSRGRPVETQWYEIWSVLFPGVAKPQRQSVYLGTALEESTSLLRSFWEDEGAKILSRAPLPSALNASMRKHIDILMRWTLDQIESAASTASVQEREVSDEDPHPAPFMMSDPMSHPSSGMSSLPRPKSYLGSPTFSVAPSPCGSPVTVGSGGAGEDNSFGCRDSRAHWPSSHVGVSGNSLDDFVSFSTLPRSQDTVLRSSQLSGDPPCFSFQDFQDDNAAWSTAVDPDFSHEFSES